MRLPVVLSIAGSDSGSGAGIQADIRTCAALNVFCATAVTAITAQNTTSIKLLHVLPAKVVKQQIETVLEDISVTAIKIGMLGNQQIVDCVLSVFKHCSSNKIKLPPIVIDPVLKAKAGNELLTSSGLAKLKTKLLPYSTLVTPNLDEAIQLLDLVRSEVDTSLGGRKIIVQKLYALGAKAVLLKGGHVEGEHCEEIFFDGTNWEVFGAKRIDSFNLHGTGCTLSSAIAAFIASGYDLPDACCRAKEFTFKAIQNAKYDKIQKPGREQGWGPLRYD